VEDSSAIWPVTIESTCLEETVTLLEKEVVFDQLFLVGWTHGGKRIVLACKFPLETVAGLNDLLLDLLSLLFRDSWTKWELCEVAADADSSALDHLGIFGWECWALELCCIHVTLVSICKLVLMVVLNEWGEEWSELII
jgi:hypothetical protein